MPDVGYDLGVDLGTTFTAAAVAEDDGVAHLLGLGNRSMQIPSVVFVAENGSVMVGEAAERRAASDPQRVVREFKRRLGDPVPIVVAGTPFAPQALAAKLVRWVVARAGQRMGSAPDHVVLTHPANWGPYKLGLMEQVADLADLGSTSLLTEPEGAATRYASHTRVPPGALVAVYDLGGGTFDACVLAKTGSGFEVRGRPEGIEHLGGIDFDEALFQHVAAVLGGVDGLDADDPAVIAGLQRLRRDCVEGKEALSEDVDAVIPVNLPGLRGPARITRTELEGLVRPSLLDTHTALQRAVHSAGVELADLDALVLVGGSSRMPIVGRLLEQELDLPTSVDAHPKHDVALGAVLTAAAAPTTSSPAPVPPSAPPLPAQPEPSVPARTTSAPDPSGSPPPRLEETPSPESVDQPSEDVVSKHSPVEHSMRPTTAPLAVKSNNGRRRLVVATVVLLVVGVAVAGGIAAVLGQSVAWPRRHGR